MAQDDRSADMMEATVADSDSQAASTREVVGTFADRRHFQEAVAALVKAGFARSDLSVLSSHRSIDAAGSPGDRTWRDALVGLVGELKYEGPLVAAGLIALAAGPVGATIAALIAAGVGVGAAKELLDEVAALPDSAEFARALAAGAVILWVAVRDDAAERTAKGTLLGNGAANVHIFETKGR